ncbi:hypothetical protein Q4610_13610 [Sphingobium sp. HBC34]|uniref:HEPN AbiU2-like domain-containing protein n=1 Tax=Sphingobium cyanobacteriorum TaxID=3063954 RepID=A0ABT8ZNH2_9SPHN|nr:hypothetical protein [Sphingobium sp. HBC34]MDO7836084.1 hypothetical protein [Sphingobium sp. HBC34]
MTEIPDGTEEGAAQALENLQRSETELLDVYQHHMVNRPFGYQDLYLLGIARRALAQAKAFRQCVDDRNGLIASAILRLQLDTVLRLYALFWVADPEAFAGRVFAGEQIDRLKAADGQQMKDRYLIDKIKDRNPWVEAVYKNTSGLIHFSDRHMHAAIRLKDEKSDSAEFFLGPNNPSHTLADFQELLEAFFHCTAMIVVAAGDWFSRFDTIYRREPPVVDSSSTLRPKA